MKTPLRHRWLGWTLVGMAGLAGPVGAFQETVLEETPGTEWSLRAILAGPIPWPTGATAWIRWQLPEGSYEALLTASTAQLRYRQEGTTVPLTPPEPLPPGGPVRCLTWQCRADHLALIVEAQVVAQIGWIAPAGGGLLSLGTSVPDLIWQDPLLQPCGEIVFSDDFMRRPEQAGGWEPLRGNWALSSLDEHTYATPAHSTNPFTYQVEIEPQQTALAAIGYWFWSDYAAAASFRAEGRGWVGLAVFLQDAHHYLLFRWSAGPLSGRVQWVLVKGETETVLAERPGGYGPRQWYRLRVEARPGGCAAFIDGQPILRLSTNAFGQGRVALLSQAGDEALKVDFDDVLVEPCAAFQEDFTPPLAGRWRAIRGSWRVRDGSLEACGEGDHWTATGLPEWSHYVVEATVEVPSGATAGLLFAGQGAADWGLLRVGPAGLQLCQGEEGKITVHQTAHTVGPPSGVRTFHLAVQTGDGYVRAWVDGKTRLEAWAEDFNRGEVGLYADRAGGRCTHFAMTFPPRLEKGNRLSEEFARDRFMREWATPAGEWLSQADGSWWHKGWLRADPVLEFQAPSLKAGQSLEAAIAAPPDGRGGYRLTLESEGDHLRWQLARGEEVLAQGPVGDAGPLLPGEKLRLAQRGSFVTLWAEDRWLAVWRDPAPLQGPRVVVRGLAFNPAQAHAECAAMGDDVFSRAPVDWWVQRGSWTLTQRWTCSAGGQWTFFGGTSDIAPILWSKADFEGDQVFEFYAAAAASVASAGRLHDLNAVLCGDGANLDSGYTVILGGQQGQINRLLRRGQVLAEAPFRPIDHQQEWPAVRIEKIDSQVRCFLNNQKVLEATDPDPLPGGKVGVWTFNGSLVLARARVWADRRGAWRPIPVLERPSGEMEAAGPAGFNNDFEQTLGSCSLRPDVDETFFLRDSTTAAQGRFSLKVTHGVSGGFFPLWLSREPLQVSEGVHLKFAYKVPPEVKINLYLRLRGEWWELTFTGPGHPRETSRWLGELPGIVADNRWHRTDFELASALKQALENDPPYSIEQMALASRREGYLWCGLGANPLGATYWLDDLYLGPL